MSDEDSGIKHLLYPILVALGIIIGTLWKILDAIKDLRR